MFLHCVGVYCVKRVVGLQAVFCFVRNDILIGLDTHYVIIVFRIGNNHTRNGNENENGTTRTSPTPSTRDSTANNEKNENEIKADMFVR